MALTDWVFPEMGYTRKQDKRALYENMIAPVYSGVTDNRSRVAEEYTTSSHFPDEKGASA